jgi:beta-lactamase regulating signal transducer with metallopeptidase domain
VIQWAFDAALSNAVAATVLAMVALTLSAAWRHPSWAHALWLIVLLKFLTPPLFEVPLPTPLREQPTARVIGESITRVEKNDQAPLDAPPPDPPKLELRKSIDAAPPLSTVSSDHVSHTPLQVPPVTNDGPVEQAPIDWRGYIIAVWMTGTLAWLAFTTVRIRRFLRLLKRAEPAPTEFLAEIASVARRYSLRRTPECRVVAGVMAPMVWALGRRPMVLVSAHLIARLNADERTSLWAHELAHLRRRDHWVRWLELVTIAIYWWHPVTWLVKRRLHRAGEESCDAIVVWSFPDRVHAYASALFKTIEFLGASRAAVPPVAVGFGESRLLKRRFQMILNSPIRRPLSIRFQLGLLAAALILLPLSIRGLWAQPATPVNPAEKSADRGPASTAAKKDNSNQDLEARLKRVEKLLEELVRQSQPAKAAEDQLLVPPPVDAPASAKPRTPATEVEEHDLDQRRLKNTDLDADRWLNEFVQGLERRLLLRQTNLNRKIAAQQQIESVQSLFETGLVTLDLLLDAHQRLSDAEIAYYKSTVDIAGPISDTPEGKRILLLLTLKSLQEARGRALETWRKVHALMEEGGKGGEADKEAQAREQYYYYKGRVEETLAALGKLD